MAISFSLVGAKKALAFLKAFVPKQVRQLLRSEASGYRIEFQIVVFVFSFFSNPSRSRTYFDNRIRKTSAVTTAAKG